MTQEEKNRLSQFDSLKGHKAFKVPDRYFDTFDERMTEVVKRHETSKPQLIIQMIKPWLTVAALFTIIAILYNVFNPISSSSEAATLTADADDLFSPILFELTEYDLVTYVVDEDISLSIDEFKIDDVDELPQSEIDDLILF